MSSFGKLWPSSSSSVPASVVPNDSMATRRPSRSMPEKMLTGIGPRSEQEASVSEKKLKLIVSESLSASSSSHQNIMVGTEAERMVISGFEDVVLRKAISETAEKLADCIEWVVGVWGDLV